MPRKRDVSASKVVHRTARVELKVTPAQSQRCFAMLRSAGDLWACVLEVNAIRRRRRAPVVANYAELCRELTAAGPGLFGELSTVAARSVLQRYSDAFFAAAKAHKAGDASVGFPRRRRGLFPVRFYAGTFRLEGRSLSLPVAKGSAPLRVRLTRRVPFDPCRIRSVTLAHECGRLFVDVTAEVPVADAPASDAKVAGVDLGIIHPFAVATGDEGLLVSGRGLRAECRLELADAKGRSRATARRAPKKGQRGSRRWRKIRERDRKRRSAHRRRIRQAHHEAAIEVVRFATEREVTTIVVGHPKKITERDAGRRQNLAVHNWQMAHLLRVLCEKATVAGLEVLVTDERGTSSTCPECAARVAKPKGRNFSCATCGLEAHRDLVGARNIAAKGGGTTSPTNHTTHRRAGRNLPGRTRRDPRRVRMDQRRGLWPAVARPEQIGESLVRPHAA